MIVPLYAPGQWFAVVTDGSVAILPPATDLGLVAEVWTSLRDGARLTEQLQMLLRGGIEALPPFALVSVEGGRVHAIVRGEVEVEVESPAGRRTLSAAAVSTWAEETIADASTVTVRTPGLVGSSTESSLPVLAAVVRAARVHVELRPSLVAQAPAEPGVVTAVSSVAAAAAAAPDVVPDPAPAPEPTPVPDPALALAPVLLHADLGDLEHTLLQPTAASVAGRNGSGLRARSTSVSVGTGAAGLHRAPAPPAEPAVQGDVVHVAAPAEPAPAQPDLTGAGTGRVVGEPDLEAVDHDGMTVLSSDVVALRQQLPAWVGDAMPGPLAVPTPRTPAPAKLLLSSGLVVSLNRPVLLGRAPQVSRVSNSAIPRLVTVASPNQDISRTHAEVRMDGEDVLVTDLRSTNGVLLLRQGSGPQRLHPGEPTAVEPGVVVDLGEGVTFTVERGE